MQKKNLPAIPTATVCENRYNIFQPTDRPKEKTTIVQIKNGTIKVTGKLGQAHKDILEFIKYNYIKYGYTQDGRLAFLIDLYQLRKALGKKTLYSYETLNKMLKDLIRTTVEIDTETIKITGNFLALVAESKVEVKHTKLGTIRKLTRIEFSKLGTMLIENDIKLFYDPIPIMKLKHGISKALARYVLSHRNQPKKGWKLDTILHFLLGENAKTQTIKDAKRLLKRDIEQLKKCGIFIENNRVFLIKPDKSLQILEN
jgi:hypothetical protein